MNSGVTALHMSSTFLDQNNSLVTILRPCGLAIQRSKGLPPNNCWDNVVRAASARAMRILWFRLRCRCMDQHDPKEIVNRRNQGDLGVKLKANTSLNSVLQPLPLQDFQANHGSTKRSSHRRNLKRAPRALRDAQAATAPSIQGQGGWVTQKRSRYSQYFGIEWHNHNPNAGT